MASIAPSPHSRFNQQPCVPQAFPHAAVPRSPKTAHKYPLAMSWYSKILLITLVGAVALMALTYVSPPTRMGFRHLSMFVECPHKRFEDLDLAPYIDQPYNGSKSDLVLKNVSLPAWYNYDKWDEPVWEPDADFLQMLKSNSNTILPAQDREEREVMRTFFNGVRNGLVLELGALDGIGYSVSYSLEALFGWRSILIEANPGLAKKLPINRPEAIAIHAAVCGIPRIVHFANSGLVGTIVELVNDPWFIRRFHGTLVTDGKIDEAKVSKLRPVTCMPLGAILKGLGVRHIDFFMLDCEGCEAEALQSLNLDDVTIDVLAVETRRGEQDVSTDKILDIVSNASKKEEYEVFSRQMGRNTWFVRKGFVKHSLTTIETP